MDAEWREAKLDDIKHSSSNAIATGPFGSSIGSRFFQTHGIPVIRGSNLSEKISERLICEDLVFVSEEKAKSLHRSIVRTGDLVFTCWGTIGQVGLVDTRSPFKEYVVSNKQMKFTPDPDKADSLFLYYLFSGPELSREIKGLAIGSSVPGFNLGQLRSLRFRLPPISEQKKISRVLGSLDEKIALNRRTNKTLEDTAHAIFKSWFVDFDPVRAKGEGRQPFGMDARTAALFPSSFEDSTLGKIPKNWKALRIGDLFMFALGGDWGRDEPSDTSTVNAAVIRGTDFSNLENCQDEEVPRRYVQPSKYEKRKLRPFDLLLEISGGTRDQPTGRSLLVTKGILERLGGEVIPASFCRLIRSKDEDYAYFLALHLAILYEEGGTWNYQNQSTGISNFQFEYFSNRERLAFPNTEAIIRAFGDRVRPLLSRMDHNQTETRCLSAIRDALLPKLLSGEIRIKDAEELVGENL